mmetsp:Transcript_83252/g.214441  ORF Transcript_83252/g.214441 Transcript_83252/m.214441 type:complete len:203 (+) Transcript_83252:402-1010(+)
MMCMARAAAMDSWRSRSSTFWSRRQHFIPTTSVTKSTMRRSAIGPFSAELARPMRVRTCSQTEPCFGASTDNASASLYAVTSSVNLTPPEAWRNCSVATAHDVAASFSPSGARGRAAAQCITSWLTSPKTFRLKGHTMLRSSPGGRVSPSTSRAFHQECTLGDSMERQSPSPGLATGAAARSVLSKAAPIPPSRPTEGAVGA